MNIVYSSSDYYSECTGVSLYSLFENNVNNELNVYILSEGITKKNCSRLNRIAERFNRELTIIEAEDGFQDAAKKYNFEIMRGSYNTYARIILNVWLSHLDKVIVIDSDTLVCDDLSKMWDINLENHLYAAVPEVSMYGKYNYIEDMDIVNANDWYYNAGICVVNLKKWREDDIDDYLIKEIGKEKRSFLNSEQSIMNKYLGKYFVRMLLRYNYYSTFHFADYDTIRKLFYKRDVFTWEEYQMANSSPAIIHYCGFSYERPWFKKSVAYRKEDYIRVRYQTPWKNKPLKNWNKRGFYMNMYDTVCYIMMKLGLYKICLRFRLVFAQKIKGIMGGLLKQ